MAGWISSEGPGANMSCWAPISLFTLPSIYTVFSIPVVEHSLNSYLPSGMILCNVKDA